MLIDNDVGPLIRNDRLTDSLKEKGVWNAEVHVHKKRSRRQIPALYKNVKVAIDCNNPGVEFINYESILYNVITLACNSRATRNVFDFPVPSRYRLEPSDWDGSVSLIREMLLNYTHHLGAFKHFQNLSRRSSSLVPNQLDLHLFSRDVVFRTFCNTFAECRHVMPWTLSIWVLYPMARVEVFTGIVKEEFEMDNDAILDTLPHVFNDKFFRLIQWISEEKVPSIPIFVKGVFPCTHVVFMSPHFILFGRDFLNEHLFEMSHRDAPILHYSRDNKIQIAFLTSRMTASVSYWADNKKNVLEMYVIEDGKRHLIDWEAFILLGYHSILHTKGSTKDKLMNLPVGGDRRFKATDQEGSYWGATLKPYSGRVLPMDMLFIADSKEAYINFDPQYFHITSDHEGGKYGDERREGAVAEVWLASNMSPLMHTTIMSKYRSGEMEILVAHLDPILESTYFKKVANFFPLTVQTVLSTLSASHFPRVLSLRDAYYPHWGETCAGSSKRHSFGVP